MFSLPLGPEINTLLFAATFSIIDFINKAGVDCPMNFTSSSINCPFFKLALSMALLIFNNNKFVSKGFSIKLNAQLLMNLLPSE